LSLETIRRCIEEAGYIPRQRNVFYQYIDDYDPDVTPSRALPDAALATAPAGLVSLN
jgi:cyclic dehypoxanthinyl futalosine synthase